MKKNRTKKTLSALLIGKEEDLLWFLPQLLSKSGFVVDLLTCSNWMKNCRFVRNCEVVSPKSLLMKAVKQCQEPYDWIILTEDQLLWAVVHAHLDDAIKLKLLPVLKKEDFSHLHSKIGLSHLFASKGIKTPSYRVVNNLEEAYRGAEQLGYPILFKIDASGGGGGVYECHTPADLKALEQRVWLKPALIQKKIFGVDLDLSALYLEGQLIHFSYAKMEKVILNRFGPSSLRSYLALSCVEKEVFDEMQAIGRGLGAHGFTNITCIEAFDGSGRYYVEADMRPNVWVDAPRFLGEELAERIALWYSKKKSLQYPVLPQKGYPSRLKIPYFLRLNFFELLINRYGVWAFIPKNEKILVLGLLLKKWRKSLLQFCNLKQLVKTCTPKRAHPILKKIYIKLFKEGEVLQ